MHSVHIHECAKTKIDTKINLKESLLHNSPLHVHKMRCISLLLASIAALLKIQTLIGSIFSSLLCSLRVCSNIIQDKAIDDFSTFLFENDFTLHTKSYQNVSFGRGR